MELELDMKQALRVFNTILAKGQKDQDSYYYEGVTAWHDADGYTCFLRYNHVTLTLQFHGTFHMEYETSDQQHKFLAKLAELDVDSNVESDNRI